MSAASARQSQRVLIDVPVQVTLREAARTLPARALDLSEGGIRLQSDSFLRVGDEVTCDLELDHEHAALNGKVRWCKPGLAIGGGAGAGVQFGNLSEDQLGLLRRWLLHNNEHAELILVHLPGITEPLRARGCIGAEGLQLLAALPQLTPGAELEFQLGEHGSRRLGRVEHVDVKPATEHSSLELAVRLQPLAAGRSRRNLVYGLGASDESAVPDSLPPPARVPVFAPSDADPTDAELAEGPSAQSASNESHESHASHEPHAFKEPLAIPKSAASRLVAGSFLVLLATGVSVFFSNTVLGPSQVDSSEPHGRNGAPAALEHAVSPARIPTGATTPASDPTADRTPAAAAPTSPEAALAAVQPPNAETEEAKLPALNSFGTKSEIFVPMQGTLNGLRSTQWTEPLAVVLDLPNAHIDAPELLEGLRGGGVRRVRLDATRPVPRLQIYLNTVAARFAARAVPHGLLVVLEHDLRPMPH